MYYPSLSKLRKTFIKVMKTSRFAFVRNKKMYPKNVYEVVQQLGGGVGLFLPAREWGINL